MSDPNKTYEVRCPVHGFIPFSDWEREVINQDAFQRLRRIRQLAWTDYAYPGAMHTRFEHSLGVMHIASQLFDAVVRRCPEVVRSLGFTPDSLERDKQIIRFTALLHDTGHGPFSHAAEDVFPKDEKSKHFKHEAYSTAVIRHVLRDVIENHPSNRRFGIKAEDVASFLEGKSSVERSRLFWRQLIDGQMDADRMDYLLRDSLHVGVDYGKYDWRRLVNTIQIIQMPLRVGEDEGVEPRLGVAEGGIHAAVALVLARYYMFTQVYFHKTRVAYDHHFRRALKELLPNGVFPAPKAESIEEYLKWDDWRVHGLLADRSLGGEHADRIRKRNHYREVYHTPESPTDGDRTALRLIQNSLDKLVAAVESSGTSTYKLESSDITVVTEDRRRVRALSEYSSIVRDMNQHQIEIIRLYSRFEDAEEARAKVANLLQ